MPRQAAAAPLRHQRLLWNAAQAYAQAAGKLGAGSGAADRSDLPTRLVYQERALELLRQALLGKAAADRAAFWRDFIQDNAALMPIRNSAGFARLAADYGQTR